MEEQRIILKDLFCTLCSLQFDKKYVFDVHLSIVHGQNIGVKTESEVCEENKTKVEEKYCSGNVVDKKFKCDICNQCFTTKKHLRKHNESVHEGKKTFKCSICDASFSLKPAMKKHIKSVHDGKKPYKCTMGDIFCTEIKILNSESHDLRWLSLYTF